jgi:hypothetical protein
MKGALSIMALLAGSVRTSVRQRSAAQVPDKRGKILRGLRADSVMHRLQPSIRLQLSSADRPDVESIQFVLALAHEGVRSGRYRSSAEHRLLKRSSR